MYAARTGYRQAQDEHMSQLEAENAALHTENAALKARIAELERRKMKKPSPRMTRRRKSKVGAKLYE